MVGMFIRTYQFFTGDKASYQRAAVYTILDVLTIGAAEIFTTPVEALQGDKHVVYVVYDLNDKVEEINVRSSKAPLDTPEKMLGIDEPNFPKPSETGPMAKNM